MKVLVALVVGVLLGAAGYWYLREQPSVEVTTTRSNDRKEFSVSGDDLKEKAREVGDELKQAGKAATDAAGDAAITAGIKAKLAAASELSARKIDVDTANGVVTLNGTVASSALTEEASRIARSVPGVKDVSNNLRVEAAAK